MTTTQSSNKREPWTYERGIVLRVVDGDTLDIQVDVGFHMTTVQRFRLMGYNAPEVHGPERVLGVQASLALNGLCPVGTIVQVKSYKGDAFGRWLADVLVKNDHDDALANPSLPERYDLAESLIYAGYGVRWDGKGDRPAFNPKGVYPNPPPDDVPKEG